MSLRGDEHTAAWSNAEGELYCGDCAPDEPTAISPIGDRQLAGGGSCDGCGRPLRGYRGPAPYERQTTLGLDGEPA